VPTLSEPVNTASGAPAAGGLAAALQQRLEALCMNSGEPAWAHAQGVAAIADDLGLDSTAHEASLLFVALWLLPEEGDALRALTSPAVADMASQVVSLLKLQDITRDALAGKAIKAGKNAAKEAAQQIDNLRRMLLAMAPDIRVVLLRLASRLQTLRWYAASKSPVPDGLANETLKLYAPLANRLGVWQMKWEMEDLAFRFREPDTYKRIARALDEKRAEREAFIAQAIEAVTAEMRKAGVDCEISGRPKHIYSIWNKMSRKQVTIESLYDLRAVRVLVDDIRGCYTALGIVHQRWTPIPKEFDDYIARPKPNGYQSLHTVVVMEDGRPLEVQIRTRDMHRAAEFGVAAHWRYKEGATSAEVSDRDQRIAWLRQLLAWKQDVTETIADEHWQVDADAHIYVMTPAGRVVELPAGSTPIDFAYYVHSDLGHRCRGAKVDGAMVPLTTALATGQTVEIVADKKLDAGPSRDWLNPELGYLASPRSRAKVRAWFNARELEEAQTAGRALVEKELARLGKTAINLQELATRMGFEKPDDLWVAASKPDFHARSIEAAFEAPKEDDPDAAIKARLEGLSEARKATKSSVLVVGVDVMTQLARCCRPAPPDEIAGFITRGKGVSIHRTSCSNFRNLQRKDADRVIECAWGNQADASYAADVRVLAADRQGLLRDISEVFARERINVTAVNTQSSRGQARMLFTVQIASGGQLDKALLAVAEIKGVIEARRR
jgi:GTP pyrophosphokinase